MQPDRDGQTEWLEWSGLPAELNKVKSGAWPVFKKLVELDVRAHRVPGTVEVSLGELGERCGLPAESVAKVVEALRRKQYIRCFIPDSEEEEGLFEIRLPLRTPLPAEEVAQRIPDPHLRDSSAYRYTRENSEETVNEKKVQEAVDLYFNLLSGKMNTFILDQIEIAASRFALDEIRLTMERAARHNVRDMGWVIKELIRDHTKAKKEKIKKGYF